MHRNYSTIFYQFAHLPSTYHLKKEVTRDNNQHDFDFPGCFATVYVNDGQTLYDNLIGLLHTAPTFKIWVSDER